MQGTTGYSHRKGKEIKEGSDRRRQNEKEMLIKMVRRQPLDGLPAESDGLDARQKLDNAALPEPDEKVVITRLVPDSNNSDNKNHTPCYETNASSAMRMGIKVTASASMQCDQPLSHPRSIHLILSASSPFLAFLGLGVVTGNWREIFLGKRWRFPLAALTLPSHAACLASLVDDR